MAPRAGPGHDAKCPAVGKTLTVAAGLGYGHLRGPHPTPGMVQIRWQKERKG
jgi:hypothetical protein